MIDIDGSYGEGGGQILRTALSLSLVTGKPFTIQNIRGKRKKPGLLRQHLTAINAAAEIGGVELDGLGVGSMEMHFKPHTINAGDYEFSVGTAGSATLVLQSVLPALLRAEGESTIKLKGGTHNPWAPPFDFLNDAFLPLINRMGPEVEANLVRPGFYPAGGGEFHVSIKPSKELKSLELMERGELLDTRVVAQVANLPTRIANREIQAVVKKLALTDGQIETIEVENSIGPGNVVSVFVKSENVTEVMTGFGEKGTKSEKVGKRVANDAASYLDSDAAVNRHLADQLLIPMAIGKGGKFTTVKPTLHTETNIEVIKKFIDTDITVTKEKNNAWCIEVCPA